MNIEIGLNILHYCFYKADGKRHLFFNKINPFMHLGKISAIRRRFEEQGTTFDEAVNEIWGDKRYGFSIMISGAGLVFFVFLKLMAASVILNSLFGLPFVRLWPLFVICMCLAYLICYLMVFARGKYFEYFQQFDKWNREEKRKYGILSFLYIVFTIVLFIYSFRFLPAL